MSTDNKATDNLSIEEENINNDAIDNQEKEQTKETQDTKEKQDTTSTNDANKTKQDEKLLAEVMEKKEKLRKAQGEIEALRKQLDGYGSIDPKEIQALLKREKEAQQKAAEARGDFEQAKKMMAEEHKRDIEAREKEIAELKEKLGYSAATIDNLTLGSNFANSNYIKDNLILTPTKARALYGSYFDIKDGQVIAYNKPAGAADRAPMVDGSGNPYDFDTAFQKIIEADPDRDTLVRSKTKEGAGSRTDNLSVKDGSKNTNLYGKSRILAGLEAEKSSTNF